MWGNISGGELCDACAGTGCPSKEDCPIHRAIENGTAEAGYQAIGGDRYKVDVTPFRLHDHEYFIVVATKANEEFESDRRSGNDRREELQGK